MVELGEAILDNSRLVVPSGWWMGSILISYNPLIFVNGIEVQDKLFCNQLQPMKFMLSKNYHMIREYNMAYIIIKYIYLTVLKNVWDGGEMFFKSNFLANYS